MVFCNNESGRKSYIRKECHNPYFNRWFSAIKMIDIKNLKVKKVTILILIDGFLQSCKSRYFG